MKLLETLPIVFVALVAAAALAFDDVPAYEPTPLPERALAERALAEKAFAGKPVTEKTATMVPTVAFPAEKSLSPNEALVTGEAVEIPKAAPRRKAAVAGKKPPTAKVPAREAREVPVPPEVIVRTVEVPRSRVDVEGRRLDPDQRIQQAVMRAITSQPNLSGQIAVESRDAVVRLSGWTTTPGQSLRAEKTAARVDGVQRVVNEIRPRMGAITS